MWTLTLDPCWINYCLSCPIVVFFFNPTATTEIYTLSLHDALPIFTGDLESFLQAVRSVPSEVISRDVTAIDVDTYDIDGRHRSEEHTSELQSHVNLVCRLLLEKKKY